MDFYEDPMVTIFIKNQEVYNKNHKCSSIFSSIIKRIINIFKSIPSSLNLSCGRYGANFDVDKFISKYKNLNKGSDIDDKYKEYEKELRKLKSILQNWGIAEGKKDKPIVIIIDELDRCRPDYAVRTLEVLKHFFDIQLFFYQRFILNVFQKL
jgi:predicted KAP-like P-loop ATPase